MDRREHLQAVACQGLEGEEDPGQQFGWRVVTPSRAALAQLRMLCFELACQGIKTS
jgi:hypothetical protein